MAAPSHPPAIAPTPAPTAAPAPAPIAVFLPGVAHPPRTTTADMTNRKLRIRISSAATVTGALGSSDRQLLGALVPDLDAVAVFEDDRFTGISRSICLVSRPPGRCPGSRPELMQRPCPPGGFRFRLEATPGALESTDFDLSCSAIRQ